MKLFRWISTMCGIAIVMYVVFLVPLGKRTLFQHARRIFATPEAQELKDEVHTSVERVRDDIGDRWEKVEAEESKTVDRTAIESDRPNAEM